MTQIALGVKGNHLGQKAEPQFCSETQRKTSHLHTPARPWFLHRTLMSSTSKLPKKIWKGSPSSPPSLSHDPIPRPGRFAPQRHGGGPIAAYPFMMQWPARIPAPFPLPTPFPPIPPQASQWGCGRTSTKCLGGGGVPELQTWVWVVRGLFSCFVSASRSVFVGLNAHRRATI